MRTLGAVVAGMVLVATAAQAQQPGAARRVSVDLGLGTHAWDGGDVESISAGMALSRHIGLAATLERGHVPTTVRTSSGSFGVTRNGTLTSISGEFRLTLPLQDRWTPYGLAGIGIGRSVLNVNEFFPDPITRTANLLYAGGGVRYALGPAAALFADAKWMLVVGRGADDLSARLPIRAGVSIGF